MLKKTFCIFLTFSLSISAYQPENIHDAIDYSTMVASVLIIGSVVGYLRDSRKYQEKKKIVIRPYRVESIASDVSSSTFSSMQDPDKDITIPVSQEEAKQRNPVGSPLGKWLLRTFSRRNQLFEKFLDTDDDGSSSEEIRETGIASQEKGRIAKRLRNWRYMRNTGIGLLTISGISLAIYKHILKYTDKHRNSTLHQVADYVAIASSGISMFGLLLLLKDYYVGYQEKRNRPMSVEIELSALMQDHENKKKICLVGASLGLISSSLLIVELLLEQLSSKNIKRVLKRHLFSKRSFSKYRS